MKKEDIKFEDSLILEGMTSISALIHAMEQKLHDRTIIRVLFAEEKKKSKARELAYLSHASRLHSFELHLVPMSEIEAFTVGSTHGGVIAFCSERSFPFLSDLALPPDGIFYMLDGVEDPYNFGNSVRSLYASGADGMIIPRRNWMGATGVVARSSAGTSELCPMYLAEDTISAARYCKESGYQIVCAGIRDSESIFEADLAAPMLVIIGGERRGISSDVMALADHIVRIDYGRSFRGSLSTSASASVIAFEILRKLGKK